MPTVRDISPRADISDGECRAEEQPAFQGLRWMKPEARRQLAASPGGTLFEFGGSLIDMICQIPDVDGLPANGVS
jgi:hypothetical protein